jgi:hypothetical protein
LTIFEGRVMGSLWTYKMWGLWQSALTGETVLGFSAGLSEGVWKVGQPSPWMNMCLYCFKVFRSP